jgi:hypothetical protein
VKGLRQGRIAFDVEQAPLFEHTVPGFPSKSKLSLLDDKGNKIDQNVYAAIVTIWNDGDGEIRSEDVRVPLQIIVLGENRIIDLTPIFFSDENIDKFDISPEYTISWKHFDTGEGLKFLILYESPKIQKIILEGNIVNIKGFSNLRELNIRANNITEIFLVSVLIIVTAVVVILGMMAAVKMENNRFATIWTAVLGAMIGVM